MLEDIGRVQTNVRKFFLLFVDEVENQLGTLNSFHVWSRHMYLRFFEEDLYAKREKTESLFKASTNSLGPHHSRSLNLQLELAWLSLTENKLGEAARIAEAVIRNARGMVLDAMIDGHALMAGVQHRLGQFHEAELQLLEAIKLCEEMYGYLDSRTAWHLQRLEQSALESGNTELAEQARQKRIEIVQSINGGEVCLDI